MVRIPKRVGAVKISKKVRRKAKKAIREAASPFVRDFATAAMAAAGRVRSEGERLRRESAGWREEHEHMCKDFQVNIDGQKLGEAFRKAAADGLRTFMEGLEQGLREARRDGDDPQPEPRAKPKAASNAAGSGKVKPAAKAKPAAKPKTASPSAKPRSRGRGPGA